ncbi:MAG: 16S rRNA (guanine(527)-N(7))-methyltransferase RsmG [Blastocatellia bacterium]|nr:16S rRNA (guanine(527)-N(7))-methyltransferase RsmG [Blastocatellia bacterium]
MATPFLQTLAQSLLEQGLFPAPETLSRFELHFRLLCEWNQFTSLTTVTEPIAAARFHFLESLLAFPLMQQADQITTWIDVGSGGGFPGLPLAAMCHVKHFILAESQLKKTVFLKEVIKQLGLSNVTVFHGRITEQFHLPGIKLPTPHEIGLLSRAIEKMPQQIPHLLNPSRICQAILWMGNKDISSLQPITGDWQKTLIHLPETNERKIVSLTQR